VRVLLTGGSRFVGELGVELPDLETQLARLRHEMEDVACGTT
jgi:hypothetical protein